MEGSDGAVRGTSVRVRSGGSYAVLNRPVQRLIPLELNVDLDVGSNPPVGSPPPEQVRSIEGMQMHLLFLLHDLRYVRVLLQRCTEMHHTTQVVVFGQNVLTA